MELYENELILSLDNPYSGYEVTNYGRVFGKRFNKELKYSKDNNGYKRVRLYSNGDPKDVRVHRLVAKYFIPNPDGLPCVNHLDGDKMNSHFSNLEWCTIEENNRHAHETGLTEIKGENHGMAKINDAQALMIINLIDSGFDYQYIEDKVPEASRTIINKIKWNQRWKHLRN